MVDTSVSAQVPTSAPSIKAIPAGNEIKLELAKVMTMAIVAEED